MIALHIKSSGEVTQVTPENGSDFTLEELQKYVNGYIEMLHIPCSQMIIVLNEEGNINSLPPNEHATSICDYYGTLVGDVLYCHTDMVK